MGRILFWLAIGFGLVMLARVLAGKRSGAKPTTPEPTEPEKAKGAQAVNLLPCPHCSLHLPEQDLPAHVAQHR